MEHPEEATPESESKGCGALGLKHQRRVVELKFFHRSPQLFVVFGVHRVDACEHHGLDVFKALHSFAAGVGLGRQGVPDFDLFGVFDARDDVADVASGEGLSRLEVESKHPNFIGPVLAPGGHEFHEVAFVNGAVEDAEVRDDATERVEDRIEDHRLERLLHVALGCRDAFNHSLENGFDTQACFAAGGQDVLHVASNEVDDLFAHHFRICRIQVHFVEHGNDLQVMLQRQVQVADGLGLNALGGVHNQKRTFTCRNGPGHFVAEVDVTWGVNQVQHVVLAVLAAVLHLDGVALDGDASLALQIHVVQRLLLQFAVGNGSRGLEEPIGQGALPVVDVGDDAEVADVLHGSKFRRSHVPKDGSRHRMHRQRYSGKFGREAFLSLRAPTCNVQGTPLRFCNNRRLHS